MGLYENMGDKLAFQYGGFATHNKEYEKKPQEATLGDDFINLGDVFHAGLCIIAPSFVRIWTENEAQI